MKPVPLIFAGPMVRALWAGHKTMTRRIAKPEGRLNWLEEGFDDAFLMDTGNEAWRYETANSRPGDIMYVRENYRLPRRFDYSKASMVKPLETVWYEAGGNRGRPGYASHDPNVWGKLRPSIFLPRWASRMAAELTEVRLERSHAISDADIIAEGIRKAEHDDGRDIYPIPGTEDYADTPRGAWIGLWEKLHGRGSWEKNPLLWVRVFKPPVHANINDLLKAIPDEA